jgi:Bacteriocin-protection, YdeI or OmpD-Associated/Domain of unknown function (DUF1905)
MPPSTPHRFQGTIYKIWMMRHVNVPDEIARALEKQSGKSKHIPVVAIVNGCASRTTLVPAGAGRYRLQLNTALRKAAGGVDAGDLIGVSIAFDGASREMPIPDDLRAALKGRARARKEFHALPPGLRRQLLLYLGRAKSPRTRARVIARFLEILLERVILGAGSRKRRVAKSSPGAARSKKIRTSAPKHRPLAG